MRLILADINDIRPEHIELLSEDRAQKVKRLKMSDDKKRCIAGGLLIKRFLGDAHITVSEFGKPVADNGMFFNISHSGRYVMFVISDCEVGCDIEQMHYVNVMRTGKLVFCQNEKDKISLVDDKLKAFFDLWTRKESLLKCIGEGFHRKAKSVDTSSEFYEENGKSFHMKTWNFADYTMSVCSQKNEFPSEIEFISFK